MYCYNNFHGQNSFQGKIKRRLRNSESRINTGFFLATFCFAPHQILDILRKIPANIWLTKTYFYIKSTNLNQWVSQLPSFYPIISIFSSGFFFKSKFNFSKYIKNIIENSLHK